MKPSRWISLIEASQIYHVPYITLFRYTTRARDRGECRMFFNGRWCVNSEDLERYLIRRMNRERTGINATKRSQAQNALQALEIVRTAKKEATNDNTTNT